MEDKLSPGGGGVDVLGDGLEAYAAVIEGGDGVDEMAKGSPQPVQAPDVSGAAIT